MQLVLFALQPAEKSLYAGKIFFRIAFENRFALRGRQIAIRNVHRDPLGARKAPHVQHQLTISGLGPRLNRAFR